MSRVARRSHPPADERARFSGGGCDTARGIIGAAYPVDEMEKATFAGGCFWGVEHLFNQVPGVIEAVSGYAGGSRGDPHYEGVCPGRTGHAHAGEGTHHTGQRP